MEAPSPFVRAHTNRPPILSKVLGRAAEQMSQAELMELKGIGKASASRIKEFVETGSVAKLEELRAAFPPEFLELVRIPGLGPKTALLLRDELAVGSVAELKVALDNEALRDLPGLGKKTGREPCSGCRAAGSDRKGQADPDPRRHGRSAPPGGRARSGAWGRCRTVLWESSQVS